jgi:SOS-response transcriptional repressor LexA
MPKRPSLVVLPLAGVFRQGQPLTATEEQVELPGAAVEDDDLVYRVADHSLSGFDIEAEDLLVAEFRSRAQTGELVVVRLDENCFVGRWWAKHGKREVTGPDGQTVIARGAEVLAVINLIIRRSHDTH